MYEKEMSLQAMTIEQVVSLVQRLNKTKVRLQYETRIALNLGACSRSRSRSRGDHTISITTSAVLIVKLPSKSW